VVEGGAVEEAAGAQGEGAVRGALVCSERSMSASPEVGIVLTVFKKSVQALLAGVAEAPSLF
jgi:hypothetical protein